MRPNTPPSVRAGADQAVIPGTLVHLNGIATDADAGDGIAALGWAFISRPSGSGATLQDSTSTTPSFVADVAGEYLLELVATDRRGGRSQDRMHVRASGVVDADGDDVPDTLDRCPATPTGARVEAHGCAASQLPPLSIALVAKPVAGSAPLSVTLTSQASGGTGNYTFAWAFGDGQTSTLRDPTYIYSAAGTYNPTVTATDTLGSTARASSALVVSPVTKQVLVPNVVGQTQAAATAAITAAQLVVGPISSVSNAVPAGTITSQTPPAGTSVAQGAAVSLVVSTGPSTAGLPPNPADVAPPLDRTVATNVAAATAFLYTGANPIQTGVAPGTIALQRAAVLRGKVIDRAGLPLAGVVVTILSHPELGQTRSRADGMFDLVVNGGGLLTLRLAAPGYINAQRQVSVPWQDWVVLEDTALVAYDPRTTLVDLSLLCDVNQVCRAQPMQVARGTPMTDADGARQATLLFQTGTTATMTLPGKPTQAITHLTVRATEFTVGPNGPKAMPANLPPTSAYTYEVEFSVDEAEAAGATRISFSQPVLSYTENFLHFPVGTIVPYGEYDRTKGVWIPMPNGRVVKILSIAGGIATLDLTGSGQAADASALTALGIGTDERQNLAKLYAAGQTLWRVPLSYVLALQ